MEPQTLGQRRVTFVEALGRGGFGSVYLVDVEGRDNFVQRLAVKVLNENLKDHADIVGRQRDEARLLAQLNHDHIVKVFDLNEIHGRPAVFMEYVEGVDVGRLLMSGPVGPRAALEIAAAVSSALYAAWFSVSPVTGRPLHTVHRDIKPANLLLSQTGMVKVLDFGIARADFEREGKTRSHQFGTARYMAPEQWLGSRTGPEVDIFALGITLVELLKGDWMERIPMMEDRFAASRDGMVQSVRDARWGAVWWRRMEDLLTRMLAFDPALRVSAQEAENEMLDLADDIGGEGLSRMARREVPRLLRQQRERTADMPLLSATDMWLAEDVEPSILTGSKLTGTAPESELPEPLRIWGLLRVGLLLSGLVVGALWVVTGIVPDATIERWTGGSPEASDAVVEEPARPAAVPAIGIVVREEPTPARAESAPVERGVPDQPNDAVRLRVGFESRPAGAHVYVDGRRVGRTPLLGVSLSAGTHRVVMRNGARSGQRRITVREGAPTRFIWIQEDNDWASGY